MKQVYSIVAIVLVLLLVLYYLNQPKNDDTPCEQQQKESRRVILRTTIIVLVIGVGVYYVYTNNKQSADLYGFGKGTKACDVCENYAGTSVSQLKQWGSSAQSVGNMYKNACVSCADDCLTQLKDTDRLYKLTGKDHWLNEKTKLRSSCAKIIGQAERARDIVSQL